MRKKQGFALAEVIVALVIVGIIVMMIAQVFASNAKIDRRSQQNNNITNIIATHFRLFSQEPSTYLNGDGTTEFYNSTFDTKVETEQGRYRCNIIITNNQLENLPHITYTITIEIFINNEQFKINDTERFIRSIVVKVGSGDDSG